MTAWAPLAMTDRTCLQSWEGWSDSGLCCLRRAGTSIEEPRTYVAVEATPLCISGHEERLYYDTKPPKLLVMHICSLNLHICNPQLPSAPDQKTEAQACAPTLQVGGKQAAVICCKEETVWAQQGYRPTTMLHSGLKRRSTSFLFHRASF